MKPGDMVRLAAPGMVMARVGLVVGTTEKKCWRTSERGKKVNWGKIKPEPHAIVMYPGTANADIMTMPIVDLEVISESR